MILMGLVFGLAVHIPFIQTFTSAAIMVFSKLVPNYQFGGHVARPGVLGHTGLVTITI